MDVKLQRTDVVTKFHPQEHSAQRTQQSSWTNQEKVEKTFDAQTIDAEKLEKQVGKLNQLLDAIDMNTITFRVHEESEQLYAQLVNMKTQEVIKTFPPEYMLELAAKMKDLVGMLIDEKI